MSQNAFEPRIEVIFFDVGNTLTFPNWKEVLEPLVQYGIVTDSRMIENAERAVKKELDARRIGLQKVDANYWSLFFERLLEPLGNSVPELLTVLVDRVRCSRYWNIIQPGTIETLEALRASYRLGIISNSDGEVASVLSLVGIAKYFEVVVDSGIVGFEKPSPEIFLHALHAMGTSSERSVHVGDILSIDAEGARSVGMNPILFDRSRAYLNNAIPRVESLQEIEELLR